MYHVRNILLLIVGMCLTVIAQAQCTVCKAVVESEIDAGEIAADGINDGIIYLMIAPYILIGGAGFMIYRHHTANKKKNQDQGE